MSTIYVVIGETGEYSDRREWLVVAYTDESAAERHVAQCTEWYQQQDFNELRKWDAKMRNPFDPDMSVDYTGTTWYLVEVELRDALPSASVQGGGT